MTQEQAATAFGLSKSGYIKIEDGDRGLKTERIARAVEIYKVPAAVVIGEAPVPASSRESAATLTQLGAAPSPADGALSRRSTADDIKRAMEETARRAGQLMPVLGEVAAGRWLEVEQHIDESRYEPAPITPDPRWRREAQYGLVVRGTSLNLYAQDGDTLHCLDIRDSGRLPVNGDLVIVEKIRDGGHLRERTAKAYHEGEDQFVELRAYSDDPRWDEPIHVPHRVYSYVLEKGLVVEIVAVVLGAYKPMPKVARR